jgi:phage shock protein C
MRRSRMHDRWRDRASYSSSRFSPNKIYKDRQHAKWCGVCAGLGDYFGIDPTILRVGAIALSIFGFFVPIFVAYMILCWVLEDKPEYLYENPREDAFWREARTRPDYTRVDLRRRFTDIDKRTQALEAYITSKQFRLNKEFNDLDRQGT